MHERPEHLGFERGPPVDLVLGDAAQAADELAVAVVEVEHDRPLKWGGVNCNGLGMLGGMWTYLGLGLLTWLVLAVALGLAIGRGVQLRDARERPRSPAARPRKVRVTTF
jgi:hypothetical protein